MTLLLGIAIGLVWGAKLDKDDIEDRSVNYGYQPKEQVDTNRPPKEMGT